jgi:hypothetical protein
MSRIFRRVQFTDYLGELRAIDDIYDDNLPQPYPTGMTINGITDPNFSDGFYELKNTNGEGKWQVDTIECGTTVNNLKPAYFVKQSDPRWIIAQTSGLVELKWAGWYIPSGFPNFNCGSSRIGGAIGFFIEYPNNVDVGNTSVRIGPYDYLEAGEYDNNSGGVFTITYHY